METWTWSLRKPSDWRTIQFHRLYATWPRPYSLNMVNCVRMNTGMLYFTSGGSSARQNWTPHEHPPCKLNKVKPEHEEI
jgi:hypothetical protein